ncbi:hypothetical protein AAF712_003147 [Marasmius tenuissimus]|uniref:Yeast cell wall synthesis Kre9/Knh1-like N-terminal domain-containing protein n=1 Tax=Marasmius tenuissimus TaxID=585030 RepID=A0ABR3A920_9AGAR
MFLTLTTLFLYASIAIASPLVPRIVFNPKIISPDANTVWEVGTTQTVKWDPTGLPLDTLTGQVVLGHLEGSDPNEHLQLNPPLAKGFLIKDGEVTITIPDVPSRKDYIVVVFGDSGNASPKFTINNPGSGTNNSGNNTAASSTASATSVGTLPSTTISDPIPISGTTITGNPSTLTEVPTSVTQMSSLPTNTAPTNSASTTQLTTATSETSTGSTTSSATGADGTSAGSSGTNGNAAGKLTIKQSYPLIALSFALSVFIL